MRPEAVTLRSGQTLAAFLARSVACFEAAAKLAWAWVVAYLIAAWVCSTAFWPLLRALCRAATAASEPAEFSRTLGVDVTVVRGSDNSLTLCVEAGQLSLQHIALDLVQRRRDRVEFAERVHCRTDIAWTPLLTGSGTTAVTVWGGLDTRSTETGQELCKTLVI